MKRILNLCVILVVCITQAALKDMTIVPTSSTQLIPCKKDWFLFGEKCYKLFEESVSWFDAQRSCSEDGSLVTIQTKELQDFLSFFFLFDEDVWIGLHDRHIESDYIWDDGSTVNFTNWQPGEPTGFRNYAEDCVELLYWSKDEPGKWNDVSCDKKLPYICQSNKNVDIENQDPRFCSVDEGGGVKHAGSCYQIITQGKTWEDAEKYCKDSFNAHLVTILNFKAQMFLNYIMTGIDRQYWIGVKIRRKSQQKWTAGWHVVFNRWDEDPEDFEEGNCGLKSGENSWTLAPCVDKFPFICETSKKLATERETPEDWICPNTTKEWKDLDGDTCYFFETTNSLSWYEANYVCTTIGGSLAIIDSERETKAIQPYVIDTKERLLIGLHRRSSNNDVFQWMDGSDLEYENWGTGQPSTYSEMCGELWTHTMQWNDIPCDLKTGYICSARKVPPGSRDTEDLEATRMHYSSLQNHFTKKGGCPSHAGEKAALGVFVTIFVVLIVVGIAIFFKNIHDSINKCFKS